MAETSIDLSGQNAIVTGGAAGMGFAFAGRLARSGANVCIWDLEQGKETCQIAKVLLVAQTLGIRIQLTPPALPRG